METNRLFWGLLLLIISLNSCIKSGEKHSAQDTGIIKADLDEVSEAGMSELFTKIEYTYLSTPDHILISTIWKLFFFENEFAVYDRGGRSVLFFNYSGKFLSKTDIPYGRGPGESEQIFDLIVLPDRSVHALSLNKISVYLDDQFVRETKFDFFAYNIGYLFLKETYILYANNMVNEMNWASWSDHNIYLIDLEGVINQAFYPIRKGREGMSLNIPGQFPEYNGEVYFIPFPRDTIYTVRENSLDPEWLLKTDGYEVPEEVFQKRSEYGNISNWASFMDSELVGKNYYFLITSFNETTNHVFLSVSNTKTNLISVFNKKTSIGRVYQSPIINDLDFGYSPHLYTSDDTNLYSFTYRRDLIEALESAPATNDRFRENSGSNLDEILSQTDARDTNPILMKFYFKN